MTVSDSEGYWNGEERQGGRPFPPGAGRQVSGKDEIRLTRRQLQGFIEAAAMLHVHGPVQAARFAAEVMANIAEAEADGDLDRAFARARNEEAR